MAICLAALLSTFVAVAGWWYLRNWLLYGEFTGTEMMLHIFGARQTPLSLAQFFAQLGEVWETFWIGFGWGNIRAQPVVYNVLGFLVTLSAVGLGVGVVRMRHAWRQTLVKGFPLGVLTIWTAMVFLEFLRWMLLTQAPHGRLLFPALPALMPLMGIGLTQLAPIRFQPLTAPLSSTALFALAAASPFLIISPAYAYPPEMSAANIQGLEHRVDVNYDGMVRLLGFGLSPAPVAPGGAIQLDLYWQSLAEMARDYSIGIHILDSNMRVIGARDSYPGHGLLPTTLWHVGEVIRDEYWVPIAADVPAPSVAKIQIALYDRTDQTDLNTLDAEGQSITPIVGRFKIALPNPPPFKAEHPTHYNFGKLISLAGYESHLDSSLELTLYWERVAPISLDYTVFVHVLDAEGIIVAQKDQQPMGGANPTSLWGEGEQVIDRYSLLVPPTAARIELGLYRADSGARLGVMDENGRALGDHLVLSLPSR
jgi:hypothetical protein